MCPKVSQVRTGYSQVRDNCVSAAAVHLGLGRCARLVVRLRHHDFHRVLRVLPRPCHTDRQQTVSLLLATSLG